MSRHGVARLVLASSMVVYGDGRYTCGEDGPQPATVRRLDDLDAGRFDVACPVCSQPMRWVTVDEDAPLDPRSGYAAGKAAQEHYARAWCRLTGGSAVALRYHNVYGPGMPRDTPYSGVAAVFRSAIESGRPPRVFEDGEQMRDFVHVDDVARANVLGVERAGSLDSGEFESFNVCSGRAGDHCRGGVEPGPTGPARRPCVRSSRRSTGQATCGTSSRAPSGRRRCSASTPRSIPADGLGRIGDRCRCALR